MSSIIRSLMVKVGADLSQFKSGMAEAKDALANGFGKMDMSQTNAALRGLNQSVKLTESEFKAATAGMDDWRTNADGLRARIKYLTDTLDDQQGSLAGLNRKLEITKETYGENSTEAIKLRTAINNQTAKIKENQSELDKVTNKLENFGKETEDATEKSGLLGKIFAGGFLANIASNALSSLAGKLKEFATKALETADNLMKMSSVTGFTTTELQKMTFIGDDLGVSMDTQAGALKKLINNMSSAKAGTGTAAEAFKALNISVTDSNGQLKDSKKVYYEVLDALKKVGNETERDAIAQDIFGKSATELNPLIEAGSDTLKALADQAETTGAVMSEDAVEALDSFGDAIDHVKQKVTSFVGETLANMIEGFTKLDPNDLTKAAQAVEKVNEDYLRSTEYVAAAGEVADDYVAQLYALEQQGLKTNEQQDEYRTIVEKLNAIMPGLNATIDAQTGYVQGGTDALRRHVKALEEETMAQVMLGKYQEMLNAKASAAIELQKNETDLKTAQNAEITIMTQLDTLYKLMAKDLGITTEEAKNLAENTDALSTYQQSAGKDVTKYMGQIGDLQNQLSAATGNTKALTTAVSNGNKAVAEAQKNVDAASQAYEDWSGKQVDGTEVANRFSNAADAAAQAVVNAMKKASQANTLGQDFMQGFINGMNAKKTLVEKQAYAVAHAAELAVASALGIHSPSTVGIEQGEYFGDGITIGLKNRLATVREQVNAITAAMSTASAPDISLGSYNLDTTTRAGELSSVGSLPSLDTAGTDINHTLTVSGSIDVNGYNSRGEFADTTKLIAERMNRDSRRYASGVSVVPL